MSHADVVGARRCWPVREEATAAQLGLILASEALTFAHLAKRYLAYIMEFRSVRVDVPLLCLLNFELRVV